MRVAFTLIGGTQWTGGRHYLLNLLRTLGQYQQEHVTSVLFVPEECSEGELVDFATIPNVEIVHTCHLNAARRRIALLQALLWGRDEAMCALFLRQHIDVVFEAAQFFGWRLALPVIAWIPDFQHRALPQMFPLLSRWKREVGFRAQIMGRRFIMLSSEDARLACERYYPATRGRTESVHFAVLPGSVMDRTTARSIADGYGLPEQFFFMPNQFWRHKNHLLVVEALAILRQRGVRVIVAASGRQSDPRDPAHVQRLQALVEHLGVTEEICLLGLIPYAHLTALMRACTALINPSLFEGWSTTVEEARAMGTPMLLSDLEVHREQMGEGAVYFERHSPESLADAIQHFKPLDETQREQDASKARDDAKKLLIQFGLNFQMLAERSRQELASR